MSDNGQVREATPQASALRWPDRVLASTDLHRCLNGHRELILSPRTVVTPLAAEHLRAQGIRVTLQDGERLPPPACLWGYAQDRPHPLVGSAVQALQREGLALRELPAGDTICAECLWAR